MPFARRLISFALVCNFKENERNNAEFSCFCEWLRHVFIVQNSRSLYLSVSLAFFLFISISPSYLSLYLSIYLYLYLFCLLLAFYLYLFIYFYLPLSIINKTYPFEAPDGGATALQRQQRLHPAQPHLQRPADLLVPLGLSSQPHEGDDVDADTKLKIPLNNQPTYKPSQAHRQPQPMWSNFSIIQHNMPITTNLFIPSIGVCLFSNFLHRSPLGLKLD